MKVLEKYLKRTQEIKQQGGITPKKCEISPQRKKEIKRRREQARRFVDQLL